MTDLRDARLRRALDAAPDANERPRDAVREAVRDAARRAVAPAPVRKPWWQALWPGPANRMPWNAAFAAVLVAVLVTLVWRDEEVPGARPEARRADPPMPAREGPAPAPAPAPVIVPAPQPTAPPATPPAAKNEGPPRKAEAPPAPAQKKAAAQDARQRTAEDIARMRDPAGLASDAAGRAAAEAGPAAAPAPAMAPPRPAPPAAAAEPPAPMARMAPPAPAMESRRELSVQSRSQADVADPADTLQVTGGAKSTTVSRGEASLLARAADQAAASARSDEALASPVQFRIEMARGTLEVADDQVRWTPRGRAPLTGRPDAAVLRTLRAEAGRLLR